MSNAQIDSGRLDAGRPSLHTGFMANRKKASGFVTEEQRHTKWLPLRLHPVFDAKIRAMAKSDGFTVSEMIEHAFLGFCISSGASSKSDIDEMRAVLAERYASKRNASELPGEESKP